MMPAPYAPERPLSPLELKASLAQRNWTLSNLAVRWRLTLSQLSRIVHDPDRAPHYEDAFRGLPALSRLEARALTTRRQMSETVARRRTRVRRAQATIEIVHEKGDLFVSTDLVDQGEGYAYVLIEPDRVPKSFEGDVVLEGLDAGDRFRIPYCDLLVLFTETGRKHA